jgi:hypothetical protein
MWFQKQVFGKSNLFSEESKVCPIGQRPPAVLSEKRVFGPFWCENWVSGEALAGT